MKGEPRIVNITATGDFGVKLDLAGLYTEFTKLDLCSPTYEPETYPALLLKVENGHLTLYSNGKYIITGVKNQDDLNAVFSRGVKLLGLEER